MTNILQNSKEWLAAKQKKVGASEIYSLVNYYCGSDLENLGFDLKKEIPFRTIQEIFLKIKFRAKLSEIDSSYSQFGKGMENFIAWRLTRDLPEFLVKTTKDFVINDEISSLCACSPDGFISIKTGFEIDDFHKTTKINKSWGTGALEIKTANFFTTENEKIGPRLQYIFQNQYQMMVLGLKWGMIAILLPKEKEYDEPFFKGRIFEKSQNVVNFSEISEYYDLRCDYIYSQIPEFQKMILKSLKLFEEDLKKYDTDCSAFPRNCENLTGLQREKQLWGQIFKNYETINILEQEDELNEMFKERQQAQNENIFAEQNLLKITNEILQNIKFRGLDKYCQIAGQEYRILWDKRGFLRFYKNK